MRQHNVSKEALQDYLKAIHALGCGSTGTVRTTALADHLGVTPASASAMVKRLAARGVLEHRPYRGVSLTDDGERIALRAIQRHRLLEIYLAQELGMDVDRVHEQAGRLEHAISDELEALIAAKLGHPACDLHGAPIPTARLPIANPPTAALAVRQHALGLPLARSIHVEPTTTPPTVARSRQPPPKERIHAPV